MIIDFFGVISISIALMNTKMVFSREVFAIFDNTILVFMSEIKIDLTLKESDVLFLLCFTNCMKIVYYSMSAIWTETQLFYSHFALILMLSASMLGMILIVKLVCN